MGKGQQQVKHERGWKQDHLKSGPIGMPPSCSMGVISSARYSQMWGMSMAMSSAASRVSSSLERERTGLGSLWTGAHQVDTVLDPPPVVLLGFQDPILH